MGLHTKKNAAANPDGMHDYNVAKNAFDVWIKLLEDNRQAKKKNPQNHYIRYVNFLDRIQK